MEQLISDRSEKNILKYSEFFKKKSIPFPNELNYFNSDKEPNHTEIQSFLSHIKEYVEPFLNEYLDPETVKKADIILSNVIADLFHQILSSVSDNKKVSNDSYSFQEPFLEKNSLYFSYLTLFYYTYITDTTDIFKRLMEMVHYNTSKILELHTNLGLLSKKIIEEFGIDDYFVFMNMFLEDNRFKTLYHSNSFQYLKPVYDRNSEAFKNVSMFMVLQREDIIEIFGLDTLSFMTQDELNFLTKQTDVRELNFIKKLYDLGVSFDKIKKAIYYPGLMKTIYYKCLDKNKKQMKMKEMR